MLGIIHQRQQQCCYVLLLHVAANTTAIGCCYNRQLQLLAAATVVIAEITPIIAVAIYNELFGTRCSSVRIQIVCMAYFVAVLTSWMQHNRNPCV